MTADPTGGARVKELLLEVLELAPSEREAHLRAACAGEAALGQRVRALLAAHASAGTWFAALDAPAARAGFAPLAPGQSIGVYTLVREIGEGGFGTVWLAEQRAPVKRRVALKLLKAGSESSSFLARFEAERQALARMEHPGIARVYDAGETREGQPYFAMEYVDGVAITTWCKERGLPLQERVKLVRDAARALQHAHGKGVIHRDIKPSNVLVTEVDGRPAPKLIDFGIAKALEEPLSDALQRTREGHFLGTPAYVSPEQAAVDPDVDARSDVYSLGALFYELLAGAPPFESKGSSPGAIADFFRELREVNPPRPSARAQHALPPELDWIALRALEKDRGRRYPTAEALAQDLQRFLDGLPVEAAPPSTTYRARKLVLRHRVAATALALALFALIGGALAAGWGFVRASREAESAQRQAAIARAANAFLNDDLLGAVAPSTDAGRGREVRVREVLDAASRRVGGIEEPAVEASVRHTLGKTYSALGMYAEAEPHLARAAELCERDLGARDPQTLAARSDLANALRRLSRWDESQALLERTLPLEREVLGADALQTLQSERRLALIHWRRGDYDAARAVYDRTLALARERWGERHRETIYQLAGLAVVNASSGRNEEAEQQFLRSLELRREVAGPDDPETLGSLVNLASFYRQRGRLVEAEPLLAEALALQKRVLGPEHPDALAAAQNLADLLRELGRLAEAEQLLDETVAGLERQFEPDHPDVLRARSMLARVYEAQLRIDEAERIYQETARTSELALGPDHPQTLSILKDYAGILYARDGAAAAEPLLRRLLAGEELALGPDHPSTVHSRTNLGMALRELGRFDESEGLLVQALDQLRANFGPDSADTLRCEIDLALLRLAQGRAEDAESTAESVAERTARDLGSDPRLRQVARDLARLYEKLGRGDQAAAWRERANPAGS